MPDLAYFDGPKLPEGDVVPAGAYLRTAWHPSCEEEADGCTVYIGPPDAEADNKHATPTVRARWAEIKEAYEDSEYDVTVEVIEALDPLGGAESVLDDVVGTRQANRLREEGYGTLQAARALPKEDFLQLDGVGESTYDALHDE